MTAASMPDAKITWYSITRNLEMEEHEAIDFQQAVAIADKYLLRADEKFINGEDAIAATMFGFSRAPGEFIEISIHGSADIAFKFETVNGSAPWFLKLWSGGFQLRREADVSRIAYSSDGRVLHTVNRRDHSTVQAAQIITGAMFYLLMACKCPQSVEAGERCMKMNRRN